MIKVMDKTFAILEEIVKATPQPLGPQKLAEKLELNAATCSRILKVLLASGYIVQVSRQAGYVAGPRILTLSNLADVEGNMLRQAVPVADALARELGESTIIAQLCREQRYVLFLVNYNAKLNIHPRQLAYNDVFLTATGIMAAAHLSAKEQLALYDGQADTGEPLPPPLADRRLVAATLAEVKRAGFYAARRGVQWICAAPIKNHHGFAASLGCSILYQNHTEAQLKAIGDKVKFAAKQISGRLTATDPVG